MCYQIQTLDSTQYDGIVLLLPLNFMKFRCVLCELDKPSNFDFGVVKLFLERHHDIILPLQVEIPFITLIISVPV